MTAPLSPREILEARARVLARPLTSQSAVFGTDMVIFKLGRERFAIESRYVFAVFPLADLVPLPGATAPVVGLTRWRGDVLTIIDLRRLIGAAPGALDDLGRVIVVGTSGPEFGVLADVVSDIVTIDPTELHAPANEQRADATQLLRGVTRDAIHVINATALIERQADAHSQVESLVLPSSSAVS